LITQAGETADTTGALREAKAKGACTLAISNVVGSTIAREADGVLYTHAGKETSIASTKAFTAQMAVLYLIALHIAQARQGLTQHEVCRHMRELLELPGKAERTLKCREQCEELAGKYHEVDDFLFLGRAVHYPIAMDGALKLKEVSYVHAEGYPTGETKHGPNALIDETLPVVILATCDRSDQGSVRRYEKTVANIEGFKKQGSPVIAVATEGDKRIPKLAVHTIFVPEESELLSPILEIMPLQIFAYYMAVYRGLDVDRPRNLTKSVTVE
jgi:glucosamine--fructose-6-phosphate aminotransferase (isomerizing)